MQKLLKLEQKSMRTARRIYSKEFYYAVDAQIKEILPSTIIEEMNKKGWDAMGIYEVVKEIELKFRREKKPIIIGWKKQ